MREVHPYSKGCWQDSTSDDTSARQGWIKGEDSARLRAMTRKQSAGYIVLVINACLRQVHEYGHKLLQSTLAARGSQDSLGAAHRPVCDGTRHLGASPSHIMTLASAV